MVGVLALQGNYQMHLDMLSSVGQNSILVKSKNDLLKCDALIIPGGESTVISKLMIRYSLFDEIKKFSKKKSIFGTCAGLVLMANDTLKSVSTLNIIDVDISRNA